MNLSTDEYWTAFSFAWNKYSLSKLDAVKRTALLECVRISDNNELLPRITTYIIISAVLIYFLPSWIAIILLIALIWIFEFKMRNKLHGHLSSTLNVYPNLFEFTNRIGRYLVPHLDIRCMEIIKIEDDFLMVIHLKGDQKIPAYFSPNEKWSDYGPSLFKGENEPYHREKLVLRELSKRICIIDKENVLQKIH